MTIKTELGPEREFDTGAKRQAAAGKGTPVLFPGDAYLDICKHFEDGAVHYGSRNWEKGLPLSSYIDSLERHIAQEKMGLTDESHDRAIAWNAICYLATKLRIQAGILPKELDDLEGAYQKHGNILIEKYKITYTKTSKNGWYIFDKVKQTYLRNDNKFYHSCSPKGFYKTENIAKERLQEYLAKEAE